MKVCVRNKQTTLRERIETTNNTTTKPNSPIRLVPVGERPPPSIKQRKKCTPTKICTYNVRSLSTRERLLELENSIENIEWDIIGLAEVRRMGQAIEEHENYILCYIGETVGLHGVGFLIKKKYKNNIVNFIGKSERLAILKLKFGKLSLTIIQIYAPTEGSSEEEINKFYKDLKLAQEQSDTHLMVIGDFNAKIGQTKPEENMITGKYGCGKRNKRGERLIQHANEHKLSVMNTFFKKKLSRRWTWQSPNQRIRNEIDYVLTNVPKCVTNVEILNQVNFPSDHRMLRFPLTLETPKISRKSFKPSTSLLKTLEEKISTFKT
ncbi:Craniofacial development protein 2 [Eumeta japonica]|uniref:Craniofacial development protein 2 n=1 Tax=Eumeta variegata TaxID=151549 RepID=A0A4C1U6M9_EUMVA|nr:Craniofacial development protein 2 [Eumeta japonica]